MPAISFHYMKDKIISGEKKQTIRPKRSDYWLKWERGDRLVGYWKQRSCECEQLFESEFAEDPFVILGKDFTQELAKRDGFEDEEAPIGKGYKNLAVTNMKKWFIEKYAFDYLNLDFVVIRWK